MILQNTSGSKKYNSIDLCKIIMALFVIAIHTHPLENCSSPAVLTIYEQLAQMAVPLFFLSSGYLLAVKYSSFSDSDQNIHITFRYLCRIVKMYILWSIAYMHMAVFSYWRDSMPVSRSILHYIRGFLLIGENYNSWHLWYLLSTIYALILVIILFRLKQKPGMWMAAIGSVCLLSLFMTEIAESEEAISGPLQIIQSLINATTKDGRILQGAFFIPIGILLAGKSVSLRKYTIFFAGSFFANFFIDNSAISNLLIFSSSVALFGVVLRINLKDRAIYAVLRKLSTDVYLIHMYIWTIYYALVYKSKSYGWDSFIATTLGSLAIGGLHLYLSKKKKAIAR